MKSQQHSTLVPKCSEQVIVGEVLKKRGSYAVLLASRDGHTRICQRNWLGVDGSEIPSDRRQGDQRDRAERADNNRIENRRLLVRGPAKVAQRRRPELRSRHRGYDV